MNKQEHENRIWKKNERHDDRDIRKEYDYMTTLPVEELFYKQSTYSPCNRQCRGKHPCVHRHRGAGGVEGGGASREASIPEVNWVVLNTNVLSSHHSSYSVSSW